MMLDQSAIESLKKLRSELFEMSKQRDLTGVLVMRRIAQKTH